MYKRTCRMHCALKNSVMIRVSGSSRSVCHDFRGPCLNYLPPSTLQRYVILNHLQQLPASRASIFISEDSVHSAVFGGLLKADLFLAHINRIQERKYTNTVRERRFRFFA